jgi:hypothetical protein
VTLLRITSASPTPNGYAASGTHTTVVMFVNTQFASLKLYTPLTRHTSAAPVPGDVNAINTATGTQLLLAWVFVTPTSPPASE